MEAKRLGILSNLDAKFWLAQRLVYGQHPLNSSMQASLSIIQGEGYLTGQSFNTCAELIQSIQFAIERYHQADAQQNTSIALRVFDLVQVWGGIMGRNPYVLGARKNKSSRQNSNGWISNYKRGISSATGQKPGLAIEQFCKIPQIGISFASKHLKFWGGFPILDTRVMMLMGLKPSVKYADYLLNLDELARHLKLSRMQTEEALFAFSNVFFPNSELKVTSNINKKTINYVEATALQRLKTNK